MKLSKKIIILDKSKKNYTRWKCFLSKRPELFHQNTGQHISQNQKDVKYGI